MKRKHEMLWGGRDIVLLGIIIICAAIVFLLIFGIS